MIDNVIKLIEKKIFTIFETTPSACMVLTDPVGHWDVSDFDIVWFNQSAIRLFGNFIARGKVNPSSDEKSNQLIENLQVIREQLAKGKEGFIGPFSSVIPNEKGEPVRVDRYTLYLGEIGLGHPTFLVLAHEKIAEESTEKKGDSAFQKLIRVGA